MTRRKRLGDWSSNVGSHGLWPPSLATCRRFARRRYLRLARRIRRAKHGWRT